MKLRSSTPTPPKLHHLLSMQSLKREDIIYLMDRAEHFLKTTIQKQEVLKTLEGRVIVNLFFESSTRTRNSFSIAAYRLGAKVLSPDMRQSSTQKGELLIDTINNLAAMGASMLVIRHPDNHLAQFLAAELKTDIAVINAGDGKNEHPTQALLDLLTIRQRFPDFAPLTIAIVGDVLHSRVARSLVIGLRAMGVANIRFIAPKSFAPQESLEFAQVQLFHDMAAGLKEVDVVYMLRIQKERMAESDYPENKLYFQEFGLTEERLALAKSTAIVMHPGPMNRGIEIESSVADGPQSVILQQTKNSVAIRMAVIETLLV